MIDVYYAPTFVRMYKKLPRALQEEVKERIEQFRDPANHEKLKVHKLSGRLKGRHSFSVNYKIRIVFIFGKSPQSKNVAYLLYIGGHDEVYS